MSRTLQKNIRVATKHWERIELAANERGLTPNQLVIELTMEAPDRREWPRTKHEIRILRSSMLTAQAVARDMIAAERGDEIQDIRRISPSSRNCLPSCSPQLSSRLPGPRLPAPTSSWNPSAVAHVIVDYRP